MLQHPEALFFLQAFMIITIPLALWRIGKIRTFVPLVVVQILVGILLGPTILGHYLPNAYHTLFTQQSLATLTSISWIGLSLFGFLTGLHFDFKTVQNKGASFIFTSLSSMVFPFLGGLALAAAFAGSNYRVAGVASWVNVLAIATAVAVTALPVLSAILHELKMFDSNLGRRVLGYAVVNDVSLWIILAIITSYSSALGNSNHILAHAGLTIGLTALFFYVMIVGVRTALNWLAHRGFLTKEASGAQLGFIVAGILLSGLITELIGIHYLFGTFVFGAMIPKDISHSLYKAFEKFTMIVLMPFFFILTGLKTTLSFSNNSIWIFFAAATLVAILGKILGTAIPERIFYKSSIPTALKSGVLMQTKGLMEVVVLNILLSAHLINSAVFSALVLMAVTTTLLTKPSLHLIDALSAPVRKLVATYS